MQLLRIQQFAKSMKINFLFNTKNLILKIGKTCVSSAFVLILPEALLLT